MRSFLGILESLSSYIQQWAGKQSCTPSHLPFPYLLKQVPSSSLLHLIPGFLKWVCKHCEVGFFFKNCQQISPFSPQTDIPIHTGGWYPRDTTPKLPTHLLAPGQPSPGHQEGKLLPANTAAAGTCAGAGTRVWEPPAPNISIANAAP